jgi:hypothetical protein
MPRSRKTALGWLVEGLGRGRGRGYGGGLLRMEGGRLMEGIWKGLRMGWQGGYGVRGRWWREAGVGGEWKAGVGVLGVVVDLIRILRFSRIMGDVRVKFMNFWWDI